jgi:site-specific recombinase XerD
MRDLRKDLRQYIDLRRALGYKLRKHEPRLTEFIAFLAAKGTDRITTRLAVAWATESSKGHKHSCFERLGFIRSFAKHVSSMDARTEIPPTGTMRRPEIALRPYIYTQEEIGRLMAAARNLFSPRKLRCHTYYHLVGLLATTGMRSDEAVRLANSDVNLAEGLITIRESKFGKSRVVPLHPTTVKALVAYKVRRDTFLKNAEAPTFFVNERRGPIGSPHKSFRDICRAAGLEKMRHEIRPRMHDLRHTFAVQTLLAWYRKGDDVERHLPILSTFLGHSHIENTYWYLSSTPELLGAACERLEKRWRRSQ